MQKKEEPCWLYLRMCSTNLLTYPDLYDYTYIQSPVAVFDECDIFGLEQQIHWLGKL